MKKFVLASIFLLISFLTFSLIGCSDKPCEGEIIEKEFLEERYETQSITSLIYSGEVVIPLTTYCTYYYPKRWRLTIQWTENSSSKEKQIYVNEECYNAVSVGDWFVYDEAFCSFKEPCEKSVEREV